METDISKITSSYDVKAFAKASYEGAFVSPSGSVDEKFKKSFENNRQNVSIRLNVLGGDESKAKALGSANGFTKSNLDSWVQSVTAENMALVGFDQGSLVPLYELIDESLTENEDGVDGKARKEMLKQYINGGMASDPDFSTYDCGTVTEFNITDLNFRNSNTLVRDIVIDGQYIGQICNEYIPNINRDERVTVVYPVINNMARYNMGFFLGNASHKPARVSWDGTNVAVEEYSDYDFGVITKLYLRGATISGTIPDGTTAHPGTVMDSYLQVFDSKYRIVKIFNNLWLGEDYHETRHQNGLAFGEDIKEIDGIIHYPSRLGTTTGILEPAGWRIPEEDDYLKIKSKLSANGITEIGKAFISDGLLGFNVEHFPLSNGNSGNFQAYMTSTFEQGYQHIRVYQNGAFYSGGGASMWSQVRFIKN